jgi:hypothetical protein
MKKTNWVKLFLALGTLMVMTASHNYANAVTDAQFLGSLWCGYGGTGWDKTTNQAGTISLNIGQPSYSYNGSLTLIGGSHPTVNLSVSQVNISNQSGGSIKYYVQVNKKLADAPDVDYLPLLGSSKGSILASTGMHGVIISRLGGGDIINQGIFANPGSWTGGKTIKVYARLGIDYEAMIQPQCWSDIDATGSCQAIIDLIIKIDPTWMVSYHGQNVPGSELYSLTFSNGFAQTVPIPSAVLYLLLE